MNELPFSPHVAHQLVQQWDLGSDASDPATSLERNTRRATVAQLEKNMRMKHIQELQLEAEVKRRRKKVQPPHAPKTYQ